MSQNSPDEQTLTNAGEFTGFGDSVKKAEIQDSHVNVAVENLEKVTTANSMERQYLRGKELAFVFVGYVHIDVQLSDLIPQKCSKLVFHYVQPLALFVSIGLGLDNW